MQAVIKYSSGDVRLDPALGRAGIFRTHKRSLTERQRERLDVEFEWGKVLLHFRGPSALDIGDQSVLLAVLEVGQTHVKECRLAADALGRQSVAALLDQSPFNPDSDQVLIRTSFRELVRISRPDAEIGGKSRTAVRQSLKRLAETTVWQRHGKCEIASRLISWRIGDSEYVELAVNERLVTVLMGKRYRPVSLSERAELRGDLAKHIHFLWSCSISRGSAYQVRVDTLRQQVYGLTTPDGGQYELATLRQQRKRVLAAVSSISDLENWTVGVEGNLIRVFREEVRFPLERPVQLFGPTGQTRGAVLGV